MVSLMSEHSDQVRDTVVAQEDKISIPRNHVMFCFINEILLKYNKNIHIKFENTFQEHQMQ